MRTNHPRSRIAGAAALAGALAAVVALQASAGQLTPADRAAGWVSLFDGRSLDGWRGYRQPDAAGTRWVPADGTLCVVPGSGRQTDILTTNAYQDFELRWEWRVAEAGNSGVKYFVLEDHDSAIGHEYQLIDDERHADARRGPSRQTAALYDVLGAENRPVKPAGQWNESRLVVRGAVVEHWLNGARVLQYELGSASLRAAIAESKFAGVPRFGTRVQGHILLQDHGEVVCFRNIAVRNTR
jgi:hypothetical protein